MSELIRLKYDFRYSMSIIGHSIEIWAEDGKLHYSKNIMDEYMHKSSKERDELEEKYGELFIDDRISDISVEEFSEKISKVNIPKWKEDYADPCVLDGWEWHVEYETVEDGPLERQGRNAKPGNWRTFRKVLAEVVGGF
ncbi:MAG: hypothetical protein K6G43_00205 [Lachnospiraceae bacterium]|nr:hypothetical protein [Lachnospiraceae bacterium]